ncbi:MAG: hypothetical protein N3A69_16795, partial [Leptospiraceae bacterium]|nr:hypothetical protein [Leptospiraceae bacterium]
YTATVKRGTIIREREVNTGVTIPLKKKFEPFRQVFSAIPDEEVLKAISGAYGILWLPHNFKTEREPLEENPSISGEKPESK